MPIIAHPNRQNYLFCFLFLLKKRETAHMYTGIHTMIDIIADNQSLFVITESAIVINQFLLVYYTIADVYVRVCGWHYYSRRNSATENQSQLLVIILQLAT